MKSKSQRRRVVSASLSETLSIVRRVDCLRAVDDEPELLDTMSDELWEIFQAAKDDRIMITKFLRVIIRATKLGIRERIAKL